MLEHHLIDGAIVSHKTSIMSREPVIATTRQELIDAAGSDFGGSFHLEELGERYTTYSPTLSAVKGLKSGNLQRVAMVGSPCQVRTVKKMQCLGILPAHIITFAIGLFCIENFAFDDPGRQKLEAKLQAKAGHPVRFEDIVKLNIKQDLIVSLNSQRGGALETIHVPLDELEEMARPACLACTDFANDYADISAGGLGSSDGYTTVLLRTAKGNRIYAEALSHGYIEQKRARSWDEMHSQQTAMVDPIIALAREKRERGEAHRRRALAVD
jgi:coenzyme F420 hydrogenase subunit beta